TSSPRARMVEVRRLFQRHCEERKRRPVHACCASYPALESAEAPSLSELRRTLSRAHRLICARSVSSTTRSNDEAFGGAFARASATYLSRLATSAESFSFSALRLAICLLTSSTRCSGFIARRFAGRSSSLIAGTLA